jgi:hypothetical protein
VFGPNSSDEMPGPKLQFSQLARNTSTSADVVDVACEEGAKCMALGIIADPSFPQARSLPRVAPLPKAQAGHQMLVDYELMAGIVWGTIKRLQHELRAAKFRRFALICISILIVALALTWVAIGSTGVVGVAVLGLTIVALPVVGLVTWADRILTVARVKSDVMVNVKKGKYQDLVDESDIGQGKPIVGWTNGVVSTEGALVCYSEVPHDKVKGSGELFSGLGFPIATTFYGCLPDGENASTRFSGTDDAIAATRGVLRKLWPELQDDQTPVRMGDVVVVNPRSLIDPKHGPANHTQPPWLDHDGRPRLRVKMPLNVPDAKVRSYGGRKFLAVQLLFGEGATVATILLRPTVVSGAAVLETVTLTMGPPYRGHEWIEEQLIDLRRSNVWSYIGQQVSGAKGRFSALRADLDRVLTWQAKPGPASPLLRVTRAVGGARPNLGELFNLDPHADRVVKLEEQWAKCLAERQPRWVGRLAELPNFRANASSVFARGNDAARHRTALILVRDRIVREVLTCFDERGYDVSEYRNESGHWHINAESIENISITENRQTNDDGGRSSRRRRGHDEARR